MNLPTTMLAARSHRVGAAAELQIDTVPVPQPGPGQVLIRVESASVNFSDVKRRRGDAYPFPTALPFTPGGEVAGTVAALGAGVTAPAVSTPVFALVGGDGQSGCAQFALACTPQVHPLPPGFDADRACGLIVAGATAMILLRHVVPVADEGAWRPVLHRRERRPTRGTGRPWLHRSSAVPSTAPAWRASRPGPQSMGTTGSRYPWRGSRGSGGVS